MTQEDHPDQHDGTQSENNSSNDTEALNAGHLMWQKFLEIQQSPHFSPQLEQSLKLQIGAPLDEPLTPESFVNFTQRAKEKLGNKEKLVEAAHNFIEQQLVGRENFLTSEEKQLMAVYLAAVYYTTYYYLVLSGDLRLQFINPGSRLLQDKPETDTVPVVIAPNIEVPFLGDKPIVVPKGSESSARMLRGVEDYPRTDSMNAEDLIAETLKASSGNIALLDSGHGDGFFLSSVKNTFDDNITTYGVGLTMVSYEERKIDHEYFGPAELLPQEWGSTMDTVFSNQAFKYFLFPDKALAEVIRVLQPDATAHLEFAEYNGSTPLGIMAGEFRDFLPERLQGEDIQDEPAKLVLERFDHFLTQESTIALINKLAQEQGCQVEAVFEHNYWHLTKRLPT